MKNLNSIFLLFALLFLVACSKDDDDQRDPLQLDLNTNFVLDLQNEGVVNSAEDDFVFLRKAGDVVVLISKNKVVGFDIEGNKLWERNNNGAFDFSTKVEIIDDKVLLYSTIFKDNFLLLDRNSGEILESGSLYSYFPQRYLITSVSIIKNDIYFINWDATQGLDGTYFMYRYKFGDLAAEELLNIDLTEVDFIGASNLIYDEITSSYYAVYHSRLGETGGSDGVKVNFIKINGDDYNYETFPLFEVDGPGWGNRQIQLLNREIVVSGGGSEVIAAKFNIDEETISIDRVPETFYEPYFLNTYFTESNNVLLYSLLIDLPFIDERVANLYRIRNYDPVTNSSTFWNRHVYAIGFQFNSHNQSGSIPLLSFEGDFGNNFLTQLEFINYSNGELMGYFEFEEIVDSEDSDSSSSFISNPLVCNESNKLFVVDNSFNLHAFDYPF